MTSWVTLTRNAGKNRTRKHSPVPIARGVIPRPPRPRNDRRFGKIPCHPGGPLLFQLCHPAVKPIHEISAANPPPGSLGARLGSFRNTPNFPPPAAKSRPPRPQVLCGPTEQPSPCRKQVRRCRPRLCPETTAGVPQKANACHSEARSPGRGICFTPTHNRFLASLGMTIRCELSPRKHSRTWAGSPARGMIAVSGRFAVTAETRSCSTGRRQSQSMKIRRQNRLPAHPARNWVRFVIRRISRQSPTA